MRKILRLEARLVVIAEDDAVLHGAFFVGLGNYICREQVEGREDRLPLVWILSGCEIQ